jgi:hypothetical protein
VDPNFFPSPDLDSDPALAIISDRIRLAHDKYIRRYLIPPQGSRNSPPKFELKIFKFCKKAICSNMYRTVLSNAFSLLIGNKTSTWIQIRI